MVNKNILVVDNEKYVVDIVRIILDKEGYNVFEAYSGEECLSMLRHTKPDLILLDLMMPRVDGWQVASAIKKDKALKDIPIALLTVKDKDFNDKELGELGISDYITKPFDREDLIRRVKKLLKEEEETKKEIVDEEYIKEDEELIREMGEDLIKAAGRIGAENATKALSRIVYGISITTTSAELITIGQLTKKVSIPAEPLIASYSPISGTLPGNIIVMMPVSSANMVVDLFEGRDIGTTKFLNGNHVNMVSEFHNILSNAYLTAINEVLELNIFSYLSKIICLHGAESLYSIVRDGTKSLLLGSVKEKPKYVLYVNVKIEFGKKNVGSFTIAVALESIKPIMATLSKMIG